MKEPTHSDRLRALREHLRAYPTIHRAPRLLYERGALFHDIRQSRAYRMEDFSTFRGFCDALGESGPSVLYNHALQVIQIYKGYEQSELSHSTASLRILTALLEVPPALRGQLLRRAEGMDLAGVRRLLAEVAAAPEERRAAPRAEEAQGPRAPADPGADPFAADHPLYDRLDQNVCAPPDTNPIEEQTMALLQRHDGSLGMLREIYQRWEQGEAMNGDLLVKLHQAARAGGRVCGGLFDAVLCRGHEAELACQAVYEDELHHKEQHQALRAAMVTVGESQAQTQLIGLVSARDAGLGEAPLPGSPLCPLGISVNGGETITILGDKRFGKSGTAQVIVEAAADRGLQRPAGVVLFLYNQPGQLPPDILAALRPCAEGPLVEALRGQYHLPPRGLFRVVYVAPEELLKERRAQFPKRAYPNLIMRPLKLHRAELKATTFQRMLGADLGNHALYLRKLTRDFLAGVEIDAMIKALDGRTRGLAEGRLCAVSDLLWDGPPLGQVLAPRTVVVVEVSGLDLSPGDVIPLFSGLTDVFLRQKGPDGQDFHKMIVLEEGHLYLDGTEFGKQVVTLARLCRHLLATLVIVSQDGRAIPDELLHLSSLLFVHRMADEKMARRVLDRIHALRGRSAAEIANLAVGQAVVAAQAASHAALVQRAATVWVRPPRSAMGGGTRFAL